MTPTPPPKSIEIEWTPGVCFECSRVCEDQGTKDHPPLCVSCVELWYPPGPPPDEDCRSYAV